MGYTELKEGKVKIWTDDIEEEAKIQLLNISKMDIIFKYIAVMPDVHVGKGATIGSVIPSINAVIPSAVGVDIGCGMNAIRLSLKSKDLPDNLKELRNCIERDIPVGFNSHKRLFNNFDYSSFEKGLIPILKKHPKISDKKNKYLLQLGTLGGGNHFIELCIDENDDVWIMLHSGSRGIGNQIGTYFIELAKKDMGTHLKNIPDINLAYLNVGTEYFNDYIEAVTWAQQYAFINREIMLDKILKVLRKKLPPFQLTKEAINCHHNYISVENHFGEKVYLTRKGAIDAHLGKLGIIPGSMGTKSYIVKGKGNPDSFCSCSHGAGRKLSRGKAIELFDKDDLLEQTLGIECRKDKGVLDEIPGAYKDIDTVMENQKDLVEIVHTLKQVMCIKG